MTVQQQTLWIHPSNGRRIETVSPAFLAARRDDPETSVAAAASITPDATEQKIVDTIRAHPRGLTADELVALFPRTCHGPTLKSALARAHKAGLVVDSGNRRDSTRGRPSIVWGAS